MSTTANTLKTAITTHELSIANVAAAINMNYALLRKKSKEPVVGAVYDPEAINFEAMAAAIDKIKIDITGIDWAAAKTQQPTKALKEFTFKVGDELYSSYHKSNFKIVYMTKEYVCIMIGDSDKPNVLHINTLLSCRIKPIEK